MAGGLTIREIPSLSGRKILFLQGPSSFFFRQLAVECRHLGAETTRLGFAPGDHLYWFSPRLPGLGPFPRNTAGRYLPYRDAPEGFANAFRTIVEKGGFTDTVMLGDGRYYHRTALAVLNALRQEGKTVTPWIVEHGYLRPDLLLVETWGMGGRSGIPAAFAQSGEDPRDPPPGPRLPGSFLRYALLDIGYHISNLMAGPLLYPRYRHHALDGTVREYAGWIGKALRLPARRAGLARAEAALAAQIRSGAPLFLFPLQLATDYQIRDHGTGQPLAEILSDILASFAAHAPAAAKLVVKVHPMDNGLARWDRQIARQAEALGLGDRVIWCDGGDLEAMLRAAAGIVTVNSTVGLTALMAGRPVKVLGRAVYDLPRLTDPQPLAGFWQAPAPPDPAETGRFTGFLRRQYHLRGGFDGPAAAEGARNVARRFAEPPPPYSPPPDSQTKKTEPEMPQ